MAAATLEVQLDTELPAEVAVGAGTAIFVCGWCYCPQAEIRSLSFVLDGRRQPVAAHGMPRLDPFRVLHPDLDPYATAALTRDPGSAADPQLRSYRSGFWGIVALQRGDAASGGASFELSLIAELEGGGSATHELGRIAAERPQAPAVVSWPAPSGGPRVAIAMATYNPPPDLFARQLRSIRAQTHGNWICVISDDCSAPDQYAAIAAAVARDERFVLSRSARRLGFYRNFERALTCVPADAEYVALSDQDDDWRPDKLERLLAGIGSAQLIYSDARVVGRDGELISDTWWSRRRNNHSDLLSLLVANSVTGAASLMRRELLDYALPFPPAQFAHFHDHWLALVALSLGEIEFVNAPLYDYVQHSGASLGHAAANKMTPLAQRLANQRHLRERVQLWRLHYFVDIWRLRQFATVLLLRCSPEMSGAKRDTLRRFIDADDSIRSLVVLGARGARELVSTPETLGAEWGLFHALGWRRLLELSARVRPQRRLRLDALPPPSLIQQPGRIELDPDVATIAAKIEPLRWSPAAGARRRINLLIPTIDLEHFFGGYIAKFNLARQLRNRGLNVRIVTVDPVGPLPSDWRRTVEAFAGLEGLLDEVEVVFGRESAAIECSADDAFIATTWWTAHIAHDALGHVRADRFAYLIQEYEPFTFAMGTFAALAAESYRYPHFALFSSELLRGYFRAHGLGVYAAGDESGDRESAAFENAVTRVGPVDELELASRTTRRLLFYARPEPHAARNMFELGVLALSRALKDGSLHGGWEFNGIGTVRRARGIGLGGGVTMKLAPRSDQASYADLLRSHDVGLALMYTPHPSLVPIEMASAGLLTVTNSFENKTPQALSAISRNLITAEPAIGAIADALGVAAAGVADVGRRVSGAQINWSTDWEQSFAAPIVDQLLRALGVEARAPSRAAC